MNVLLPTPGTPEMPSRNDRPLCGSSAVSTSSARGAVVGARRLEQGDGLGDGAALPGPGRARTSSTIARSAGVSMRVAPASRAGLGLADLVEHVLSRSPGPACRGRRCP